mmetsp:Transcript_18093/g.30418  ORF Transcript_18093/g.30418 Transcript_18093/m.30418 type:complete len:238 (+) Transcript_18093:327-1040(+)
MGTSLTGLGRGGSLGVKSNWMRANEPGVNVVTRGLMVRWEPGGGANSNICECLETFFTSTLWVLVACHAVAGNTTRLLFKTKGDVKHTALYGTVYVLSTSSVRTVRLASTGPTKDGDHRIVSATVSLGSSVPNPFCGSTLTSLGRLTKPNFCVRRERLVTWRVVTTDSARGQRWKSREGGEKERAEVHSFARKMKFTGSTWSGTLTLMGTSMTPVSSLAYFPSLLSSPSVGLNVALK